MKLFGFRAGSFSNFNEAISQRGTYETPNLTSLSINKANWQAVTPELRKMITDVQAILNLTIDASGNDEIVYGVILELHGINIFISLPLLLGVVDAAIEMDNSEYLWLQPALWRFLLDSHSSTNGLKYVISPELKKHLDPQLQDWALELAALNNEEFELMMKDY